MNVHIAKLLQRRPELEPCRPDIEKAYAMMRDCYRCGGKMLLCGNGGSAADAEHWAAELLKGFVRPRILPRDEKQALSTELGSKLQGALPAIPLTGFVSFNSAFANDVDPHLAFAQLVWGLGRPGDILVGISTSGHARNVRMAMEAAKARGLCRLGLSGRTGGQLGPLCDLCIKVPANETYLIQELHLPIYHCLSMMLEDEFFSIESLTQLPATPHP